MAGKKILLADDSMTIQKVIRLALSNEGYEIQAVSDGNEALQQIALFRPDVVLLDISLPGKGAFEIKQAIDSQSMFGGGPKFVLMSSAFERVDEAKEREARFNGRLTKPFDPAHLRQLLTELTGGNRPPAPSAPNKPTAESAPPSLPKRPQESLIIPNAIGGIAFEPPTENAEEEEEEEFTASSLIPPIPVPPPPMPRPVQPRQAQPAAPAPEPTPSFADEPQKEFSKSSITIDNIWNDTPQPTEPLQVFSSAFSSPPPAAAPARPEPPPSKATSDVRELTDNTFEIAESGKFDREFPWSVQENSSRPVDPPAPKPISIPSNDENSQFMKTDPNHYAESEPVLPPLGGMADLSGSNYKLGTGVPQSANPASSGFSSSFAKEFPDYANQAYAPEPPAHHGPPEVSLEPAPQRVSAVPLSTQQMEDLLRSQLQDTLEKLAQKILPEVAERVIKAEIRKMLSER